MLSALGIPDSLRSQAETESRVEIRAGRRVNDSANTLNSIPAESWFVATSDGAVEYHLESLKNEIKQGRVHLSTLVWRNGMQSWVELEQVPLLRMLVTVQPSPLIDDSSLEPVTQTVSSDFLDDLSDDKTTVLESEVALAAAENHWQASAISARQPALEVTPTGNAFTEETAEPVTIRPAQIESTVTQEAPDSTSIFKGLFDNAAFSGDVSDYVVTESDISGASEVVAAGSSPSDSDFVADNDLVGDNDIRDDEPGVPIPKPASPVTDESSSTIADFSDAEIDETAEAEQPLPGRPLSEHASALQDPALTRQPTGEFAQRKPRSLPAESIRPILARPTTPRVAITGISTRATDTRSAFLAPKREPISEGLARSLPTRVFSEKTGSTGTPPATPRPLYTPLIQPPTPVPTMRPLPPARTSPARVRTSILPPLSPLPVTEHQRAVDNDLRTAVSSPTSAPKPKLERPVSIKPNRSVAVHAVIPVAQSVPSSPLSQANNGALTTEPSANNARRSSPTLVGMPPHLEAVGSTVVGMPPLVDTALAPGQGDTRTSEPTIVGMPPRIETIRAPVDPAMFGMQPFAEPLNSASTESTFIGMPPRLEPSIAPAESDQILAPPSSGTAPGDSIYPSISSIHPALRGPRNVRRTLIMMGAVGVAAAASVVFAFTQSGHEQQAESAISAGARAGNHAASVPAAETIETPEHPVAKSLEIPRQESAAAADKPTPGGAQTARAHGSDEHAPMPASVQPAADEKTASASSGARPHNNRLARNVGVMPVTKSVPQVGNQPSRNKATPTAEWDQGTVEKRAWMSPGF